MNDDLASRVHLRRVHCRSQRWGMGHPDTAGRNARIFAAWFVGNRQADIAREFDISPERVRQILDVQRRAWQVEMRAPSGFWESSDKPV